MDYRKKLYSQISNSLFLATIPTLVACLLTVVALNQLLTLDVVFSCIIGLVVGMVVAGFMAIQTRHKIQKPIDVLSEAISYASNNGSTTNAPNANQAMIGRELVTGLTLQIYNLASSSQTHVASSENDDTITEPNSTHDTHHGDLASSLLNNTPTPLVGMNSDMVIQNANTAFATFVGISEQDIIGKDFNSIMSLNFPGEETLETWISKQADQAVVSSRTWDRVRFMVGEEVKKQFDMVAGYSSGSSSGTELIVSFFDRTGRYNQDDQEVSYVALAVHELRTPLTIMRGYIEVFEDEVGPTLDEEMTGFLHKMQASAQQLTAFVGNMLNIARIEEDQLSLKLHQEDITSILKAAINDLQLRASVYGKTIELKNGENLPTVGADRTSIHEVINNLVDNAIKYSEEAQKISVRSFENDDGLVQVDVQDYGIGIPASVMPQLFQKFHRSHKSKVQVGGTGLGLFLCKALIAAHGGNIWVRSKEGEGATFSFTLLPYDRISSEAIEGEDGIIRGAHGWIKNHSLYRN